MLTNDNIATIEKWILDILWDLNNGEDILGESDNSKNDDLPRTIDKIKIKLGCILDIIGHSKKIPEGPQPRFNVKSITKGPDDQIPGCVQIAAELTPIDGDSTKAKDILKVSSEASERIKEMLKADEIKFNKIMEEFDE